MNNILKTIEQLEKRLLDPQTRKSKKVLNELLAEGFKEFGSSGRVFSKEDIINRLPQEDSFFYSIEDISAQKLSVDTILLTYKLEINSVASLRTSIWQKNRDKWQMIFHQGTKVLA